MLPNTTSHRNYTNRSLPARRTTRRNNPPAEPRIEQVTYRPPIRTSTSSNMERRTDVPTLNPDNYGPWIVAQRSAAYATGTIHQLEGNPEPPTQEDEQQTFQRAKHMLLGKIITSIPSEIANLVLTPTSEPTPYDLVKAITAHLDTANADDQKYLKQQAEQAHFTHGMTLQEYITVHEGIRSKMIAARYPEIQDTRTTVAFMIDGLRYNPTTAPIGMQLIALNPTTVQEFAHRYNRIAQYQNAPTHTRPAPISRRWATLQTRRQPLPRQLDNPCRYHQLRGIIQPQHTDEECRNPNHPKNKRAKGHPKARVAYDPEDVYEDEQHDQYVYNPRDDNMTEDDLCTFILDSGAHPTHLTRPTKHMRKTRQAIHTSTATNTKSKCTHHGKTTIRTNKNIRLQVPAVANPAITTNLISVHDLARLHGNVLFTRKKAIVYKNTAERNKPVIVGTAPWNKKHQAFAWTNKNPNNAYSARSKPYTRTQTKPSQKGKPKTTTVQHIGPRTPQMQEHRRQNRHIADTHNPVTEHQPQPTPQEQVAHEWHLKLNHATARNLRQMAKDGNIPTMPKSLAYETTTITCSACTTAKQRPEPHRKTTHNYDPDQYLSSDTCGPISPISTHGNIHFLTYIDAGSRYLILYFLKDRRHVGAIMPQHMRQLYNAVRTPQYYRTGNALEFKSKEAMRTYAAYGITYKNNTPHQPQENSLAERINQTLMNAARANLQHAKLPPQY